MKRALMLIWLVVLCCGFTMAVNADEYDDGCDHNYTYQKNYKKVDDTYHSYDEVCNYCGKTVRQGVEKHDWYSWIVDTDASCGSDGTQSRECYACGTIQTEKIPATGKHSWGEWEISKPASIKNAGQKKRVCEDCGKKQTTSIAKLKPNVKFTKKKYTINARKTLKLRIIYSAGDTVKKFKSSNKKVVTVAKNGRIKAKRSGTAKITVIMKSGVKATCKIKVKAPKKKTGSGGSGTVYWTPGGSVYHKSRNCPTLKRSRIVYSGSIADSGKPRACKVCS